MPYCTQCGKPVREEAKFCTSCGKPIDVETPPVEVSVKGSVISIPPVMDPVKVAEITPEQTGPDEEYDVLFPQRSKKRLWMILGIILFAGVAVAAWFFYFSKSGGSSQTLYVIPDNLKLRSSQYDNSDANILTTASYGSRVDIIADEGDWIKVKYNENEGYMRTRYLVDGRDFFETDAIIHTMGKSDTIRETRFKKSLLAYFRQHNYKPPFLQVTDFIDQTFLSDTSAYKDKEEWKIAQAGVGAGTFVRGKFTNSSKSGMAVIIQKNDGIGTNRKLLIFNYDEAENELPVSEFTGNFRSIDFLGSSDDVVWFINDTYQFLSYNALHANEAGVESVFMFNGATMQRYQQPSIQRY